MEQCRYSWVGGALDNRAGLEQDRSAAQHVGVRRR